MEGRSQKSEVRSQELRFTPQEIDEWRLARDIEAIFRDPRKQLFTHHSILAAAPAAFAPMGSRRVCGSASGSQKKAYLKLH